MPCRYISYDVKVVAGPGRVVLRTRHTAGAINHTVNGGGPLMSEGDGMATSETTNDTRDLIMELLGDGGWHSHRKLVGDLIRTPMSEYAIRSALRLLRNDPAIEIENRRASYRHGPAWWYRLNGPG